MALSRSLLNIVRWRSGTPNALQAGRVDAHLGALADGVVGVKRVQSGTSSYQSANQPTGTTSAVAIPIAVNVAKSILLVFDMTTSSHRLITPRLTGQTTITLTVRSSASTHSSGIRFFWHVVEFY